MNEQERIFKKRGGGKKFGEEEVAYCRREWPIKGTTKLAIEFNVTFNTMHKLVKGITYCDLNYKYPPWR